MTKIFLAMFMCIPILLTGGDEVPEEYITIESGPDAADTKYEEAKKDIALMLLKLEEPAK